MPSSHRRKKTKLEIYNPVPYHCAAFSFPTTPHLEYISSHPSFHTHFDASPHFSRVQKSKINNNTQRNHPMLKYCENKKKWSADSLHQTGIVWIFWGSGRKPVLIVPNIRFITAESEFVSNFLTRNFRLIRFFNFTFASVLIAVTACYHP